MSTQATPATLDVSGTPPIPFGRLVRVELRKMLDTRAGRWLLIGLAALIALVLVIQLIVTVNQGLAQKFTDFGGGANYPMVILLPVLGAMSVTGEWSQRTAMVTFALVPSRGKVLAAKYVSALILALVAVVTAIVLMSLANLAYAGLRGVSPVWDTSPVRLLYFFLLHLIAMSLGFAFGAALLNTAAAIVLFMVYNFVLPGLMQLGAFLMHWFDTIRPWIDFNQAQNPLVEGDPGGSDWAHLVVSGLIWLGIPLVIGVRRVLRSEVK